MGDGTIMCLDVELDQAIRRYMGIESGPVDKTAFIERLNEGAFLREERDAACEEHLRQTTM